MSATAFSLRRHTYLDSVFLMRIAKALESQPGVSNVAALMATPANKGLLFEAGFSGAEVDAAGPDDLIVGVAAQTGAQARSAIAGLDALLAGTAVDAGKSASGWDDALSRLPNANLAVISVPGEFAAAEIEQALDRGLHVFCFSSNVPLGDEVRLKQLAASRDLLLMGPDCGTAMIAGKGLGFSNVVRRGPIGIVGGSGSGIQAVSCLIDAAGSGVSHAIGCGSRDLSDDVGGITTFAGLHALADDAQTKVIVVVSKTPGQTTLARLQDFIAGSAKPVVTCFLGGSAAGTALTFEQSAAQALQFAGAGALPNGEVLLEATHIEGRALGLFAGGSLLYETQRILEQTGISQARYELIDMGSEELTRGRAHPMIDARLRADRVIAAADDPTVGILLLDFVLGRGAAADPAGDLIPAIREARSRAARAGRNLGVVASVCGTDRDPQDRGRQTYALIQAGVVVLPTSAKAARCVAESLQ
jgi:FdrA protein